MVILKKIVIMTQYGGSNCSGIVKFENFAGRTSCFVRILGIKGEGVMCIKCGDDVMYCGKVFDGEKSFNALYDLNKTLQIVAVADGSIVCMGSNKGRFSPNAVMLEVHKYYASLSQSAEVSRQSEPTNQSVRGHFDESRMTQESAQDDLAEESALAQAEEPIEQIQADKEISQETASSIYVEQEAQLGTNAEQKIDVLQEKKQAKTEKAEPFYKKIEESLAKLFDAHEKDEELTLLIPNSKWARVPVEGDGYYVVGVIENDGIPDIICYGVPDKDSSNPPQNSSDCRQWMELEKGGRGYWMMYQSAASGQTLTTSVI